MKILRNKETVVRAGNIELKCIGHLVGILLNVFLQKAREVSGGRAQSGQLLSDALTWFPRETVGADGSIKALRESEPSRQQTELVAL